MEDKKTAGKYELDEITIRKAENGFVVRFRKKLTKEARAEQEKIERKSSNGGVSSPSLEYHQSEEYVAEGVESVLKRVKKELTEYSSKPSGEKDDMDDTKHGNYQADGIGFR